MKLEPLHPIQIQRFREMSFEEKWAVAKSLYRTAVEMRMSAIRRLSPELSEAECRSIVAHEFARSRT
jgi:hypothetical protein